MRIEKAEHEPCPCGVGPMYRSCCRPLLAGEEFAKSPEALMRSRYTAFCLHNSDYLMSSLAVESRRMDNRRQIESVMGATTWIALKVVASQPEPLDSEGAWVEFVAFFQRGASVQQLHEKSLFVLREQRWYYLKGDILPPLTWRRNEACWCGSGKKYKKCHG